jgi:hypothetical protein
MSLIFARVLAPRLPVDVDYDGAALRIDAGGSHLESTIGPLEVDRIAILAGDTIDPPGGDRIVIDTDRPLVDDDLPGRFIPPGAGAPPAGDWWLDRRAACGVVWQRTVDIKGPFHLAATLRGRFHSELRLVLDGRPGLEIGLRSGLNRNDIVLRDSVTNRILAWTSIDPSPVHDVAALASTVLDGIAGACLLAALCLGLGPGGRRSPPSSAPSTGWLTARRTVVLAVVLAAIATAMSLWLATSVLEKLPHTADEAVQWLQARWILDGRLWQPVVAWQDQLDLPFTYVHDGRWIAQYPVLWPALLAPFVAMGVPWLWPPILGGISTVLLFQLGSRLYGHRVALLATLLATLSPLGRILFSTTLSHAAALTLLLISATALEAAWRRTSPRHALVAGLALGLAFGMRPLPALAIALTVGVAVAGRLGERSTRRVLAALVIGGVVGTLPTLAANLAITGNPLHFGYSLAKGSIYSFNNVGFALQHLDAILVHLEVQLLGWGWGLPGHVVWRALPLSLALLPFLIGRSRGADRLLLGAFTACVALLLGSHAHGLYCYGARYLFEVSPCLLLLVARGISILAEPGPTGARASRAPAIRRVVIPAVTLVVALTAVGLPARLEGYRDYFHVDRSFLDQLDEHDVERAVVLFVHDDWRDWLRVAPRNLGRPDAPLIFARSGEENAALVAASPDRPVWRWDHGLLVPATASDD